MRELIVAMRASNDSVVASDALVGVAVAIGAAVLAMATGAVASSDPGFVVLSRFFVFVDCCAARARIFVRLKYFKKKTKCAQIQQMRTNNIDKSDVIAHDHVDTLVAIALRMTRTYNSHRHSLILNCDALILHLRCVVTLSLLARSAPVATSTQCQPQVVECQLVLLSENPR
jgi:hypothetical protein